MLAAKRLKPLQTPTPQCDAPFDRSAYNSSYWTRRLERAENKGWDVDRCMCHSSVRIMDKNLCTKHAATVALNLMLEAGEANATES